MIRLLRQEWHLFENRDGADLEERVADWLKQHEPADWLSSSLVLGALFIAMVLFAFIPRV